SMLVKTGLEDTDIIFTDKDVEDFNLNGTSYLKVVSLPQNGSLLYDHVKPSPDHEFTPVQLSEGQEVHVSVLLSGIMLYRPETNFSGTVSFLWRANKNGVWTDDDMVKLIVYPVNDAPVIGNINMSGTEDTNINFQMTDFSSVFNDVDGDLLNKIKITGLPDNTLGSLVVNNNPFIVNTEISPTEIATLTFKPQKDKSGRTEFLWNAFDGESWTQSAGKCTLDIAPIGDTPISQSYVTLEDTATSPIFITRNAMDGDEILYFKISNIQNGKLFVDGN
ncbi:hypothetical protein MHK_003622, partial [Candidatus Magnetomorum sp. HK-1]